MKSLLIIMGIFFMLSNSILAQDIIYKLTGEKVEVKVSSADQKQVKYKRLDNLDGPDYFIEASKIIKVEYENGSTVWYNKEIEKTVTGSISSNAETKIETTTETSNSNSTSEAKFIEIDDIKPDPIKLKRHTVYGEILGMSGFFSINYLPTIISSPNGAFSIKARVGVGMSNKSIHFPHGILFGFGSPKHQFEIGFQGAVISGFASGDVFEFLHDDGKGVRYSFSPTIGYRLTTNSGFTLNFNILVISAENASGIWAPLIGHTSELSPWFGIGLGYAF